MAHSLYYTQHAIKEVPLEKIEELPASPSETTLVKFQGWEAKQEHSLGKTIGLADK